MEEFTANTWEAQFITPMDEIKGWFKVGRWPSGSIAWGSGRMRISGPNRYGRSGFSIHGGSVPGSAGCIDVLKQINPLIYAIRAAAFSTNQQIIPLSVKYK